MDPTLDLLAIMAHPDDAELLCGGALTKSARAGDRVGILDLTRGESGSFGSADLREQEASKAAEIIGLTVRRNAGLPDAALENTLDARLHVAALIRELRPAIVVTHWRAGRHPDHRVASQLVYDSCFLAGLKSLQAAGEPFRPTKLVYATAFREDADPPSVIVDITEEMETKIQALEAYGSQFDGKTAIGEVFPGGDRPVLDQIRVQCAHYGSLIRVGYGEPFRTDEARAIRRLTDLTVSSF